MENTNPFLAGFFCSPKTGSWAKAWAENKQTESNDIKAFFIYTAAADFVREDSNYPPLYRSMHLIYRFLTIRLCFEVCRVRCRFAPPKRSYV
ncbi:MAG: hypothetical protein BGO70_08995 [Bacteroidetes bacterium 43-93]|nr:MAG: hypothetical protein BGO70_08995 [Bacteroidetes bacterium 43-93]